jgi:transposase InsO family protein
MWSAWPNSSSAFIDDHSRLIPGRRWGFAEDTVRLAAAFRQAVQARGVPRGLYVDNSAYVDAWLLRACANWGYGSPIRPPADLGETVTTNRYCDSCRRQRRFA